MPSLRGGSAHPIPLGSSTANPRSFVAADGTWRGHAFGDDTRREVDLGTLVDHLARTTVRRGDFTALPRQPQERGDCGSWSCGRLSRH